MLSGSIAALRGVKSSLHEAHGRRKQGAKCLDFVYRRPLPDDGHVPAQFHVGPEPAAGFTEASFKLLAALWGQGPGLHIRASVKR